jgi:hypothetical protein
MKPAFPDIENITVHGACREKISIKISDSIIPACSYEF